MEHVKILFPSLHKGIKKDKNAPDESPYNYVSVLNGHAIVCTPQTVVCFNMWEYFMSYQVIPDDHKPEFSKLMAWMEGKHFTSEFWDFLTKWNHVSVVDENRLRVVNEKLDKELVYHHIAADLSSQKKLLKDNWENGKSQIANIAISNYHLKLIYDAIGTFIQKSALIFEFYTISSTVRFAVDEMNFIFGVLLSSGSVAIKPDNFKFMKEFIYPAPPPPPAVEEDYNDPDYEQEQQDDKEE